MKIIFQLIKATLIFGTLTIISQIGGIVYLLYKIITSIFLKGKKRMYKYGFFVLFYSFISILLIPIIAKQFGREALPYFYSEAFPIKPANKFYCLLNRNYVKTELKNTMREIALEFKKKNKDVELVYLDANFPFIDEFPLLPHKSHDDGKKLDLSFLYLDKQKNSINKTPNFVGYGFCEEPKKNETDKPEYCKKNGYWQYNLLKQIMPNFNKGKIEFDEKGNKDLLQVIAKHKNIGKIFIEPHLKERLRLSKFNKIRFHGCGAVRHDDHIHIQL